MEYRQLGGSGFKVPVLTFGTGTFGGTGDLFTAFGTSDVAEATRLVDICLDAGLTMFDSADVYSAGRAEEILGKAIAGRRDQCSSFPPEANVVSGDGSEPMSAPRAFTLIKSVEASLKRLGTDYIDLFQLHGFDALTPVEETLSTLDDLRARGKNPGYPRLLEFSGWHLMKFAGGVREIRLRALCRTPGLLLSLVGRSYEWELMPLPGLDQKVGIVVWSPLGWARLDLEKVRRSQPLSKPRAVCNPNCACMAGRPLTMNIFYRVVDAIDEVAREIDVTVPQDRAQLAAASPDRFHHYHRRAQRGTVASEFGSDWLESDGGTDRAVGCRQRDAIGLSLFPSTRYL